MKENQERYNQTLHPFPTPPMTEPLYSEFTGPNAEMNFQSLLKGSYVPPRSAKLDRATLLFLDCCKVPESCKPMSTRVSLEDHTDFWSKNPENKGSEPHGLHNGHFKAGVLSSLLAACDSVIRDIPWSTGFSPDQWKHLMNFAIEKKPGELRVKKMRTIQMMNSELQANNKKIGRMAMQFAETHHLIPEGQHGSRKQRQAEDAALSEVNEWDEMRCQRSAAGWICNDAKSCFDRVVHWVGWIALLRFGIGYNALKSMFQTLMTATHRVRTGFGDSVRSFSPPSRIPFHGCGQGNGAGPTIWVACSSIIIDAMDKMGFGFIRQTAISLIQILSSCFSFVDDTDLVQAAKSVDQSGEAILSSIQECLTLWAGLVRSTGGAINPEKSFWWMIDFKWVPSLGCWKFRRKDKMPGSLSLMGLTNQMEGLTRRAK